MLGMAGARPTAEAEVVPERDLLMSIITINTMDLAARPGLYTIPPYPVQIVPLEPAEMVLMELARSLEVEVVEAEVVAGLEATVLEVMVVPAASAEVVVAEAGEVLRSEEMAGRGVTESFRSSQYSK